MSRRPPAMFRSILGRAASLVGVLLLVVSVSAQQNQDDPPAFSEVAPSEADERQATAAKTTAQIAREVEPAVVTIAVRDKAGKEIAQGSGFIVRSDGVIVTNWHVLVGASSAVVTLPGGESFNRVAFIDGDENADIAIIKVPGFGLPTVAVTPELPAVGDRVVAMGSPLGLSGTVSDGIVSAVRLVDGRQLVQTTAAISKGSSGGPLLDGRGRAFGITTLTLQRGQNLNFAVPAKYAMGLIGSSSAERPLSQVFASSGPVVSATAGGKASERPDRAVTPRENLHGTFVVKVMFRNKASQAVEGGKIATFSAGADDVGLLAFPGSSADKAKAVVFGISTFRTNGRGEVALAIPGMSFGGYQTDDGFWASGDDGEDIWELHAVRFDSPIYSSNGLYRVQVRTSYRRETYRGGTLDWVGDAAIYATEERVHIDMVLRNSAGGGTAFFGSSPLINGRFTIAADGGKWLVGTIRAGALLASWKDIRDDGAIYEGELRGTRK